MPSHGAASSERRTSPNICSWLRLPDKRLSLETKTASPAAQSAAEVPFNRGAETRARQAYAGAPSASSMSWPASVSENDGALPFCATASRPFVELPLA